MDDEENEDATYLTFYTAPRSAIPRGWKATPDALAASQHHLRMIEGLSFSSNEALQMLRDTAFKAFIPALPKGCALSAARLGRRGIATISGKLHAGPWAAAFPGLIGQLAEILSEALDDENPILLVIRELEYPPKKPGKTSRRREPGEIEGQGSLF